jgi:hypothetical protein
MIEKKVLQEVTDINGITGKYVRQIYERTYEKIKSVTELLAEIDDYNRKLQHLNHEFTCEVGPIKSKESKNDVDSHKKLTASHYSFSTRVYSTFEVLDIHTIGQLAEIVMKDFHRFIGFKAKCKKELISFIEFENMEHLFEGFSVRKTKPIE